MSSIIDIELLIQSRKIRVGCLAITNSNKTTCSFEYDSEWLQNGFALGADLPLVFGVQHVKPFRIPETASLFSRTSCFGFLCDSAPGSWIPAVVERPNFFGLSKKLGFDISRPESVWWHAGHAGDRFSAYSYQHSGSSMRKKPTTSSERRTLSRLVRLMEAYPNNLMRFVEDDIGLLLDCTTDLGGSSIKGLLPYTSGSKTTDRVVWCKPPDDPYSTPLWMAVTASLAKDCGIALPDFSYEICARYGAYLEERFDRTAGNEPLVALSAATLCSRPSAYKALTAPIPGWLDVADILNREGSRPAEDLRQLFLRLVFATFVNLPKLTLDHIWFIRSEGGWRLAPFSAPCARPPMTGVRQLAIPLTANDASCSLDKLQTVSRYFGIPRTEVRQIAMEVARAVHSWRDKAARAGADLSEIAAMQSAFLS